MHIGGLDAISAMSVLHSKNCGFHRIGALFPRARASVENQEKRWKNISPDHPKGCPSLPGRLQNGVWRHVRRRNKALDEHQAARNCGRRIPDATGAVHERNMGARPLNFELPGAAPVRYLLNRLPSKEPSNFSISDINLFMYVKNEKILMVI